MTSYAVIASGSFYLYILLCSITLSILLACDDILSIKEVVKGLFILKALGILLGSNQGDPC